jgi:hypothetical protein
VFQVVDVVSGPSGTFRYGLQCSSIEPVRCFGSFIEIMPKVLQSQVVYVSMYMMGSSSLNRMLLTSVVAQPGDRFRPRGRVQHFSKTPPRNVESFRSTSARHGREHRALDVARRVTPVLRTFASSVSFLTRLTASVFRQGLPSTTEQPRPSFRSLASPLRNRCIIAQNAPVVVTSVAIRLPHRPGGIVTHILLCCLEPETD